MNILRAASAALACAVFAASVPFTADAVDKQPELIDVSAFTIYDENFVHLSAGTYLYNCMTLFDDQDKLPAAPGAKVDTDVMKATDRHNWTPNWQADYGDAMFYIDLGANYVITDIDFLDTNGAPTWTVSVGEPFDRKQVADVEMNYYNSWRTVRIEKPEASRYLFFRTGKGDTGVAEIALYGYKESELTAAQKKKTDPKPKEIKNRWTDIGQAFGFNAFIDDPITAIMAGGNVREYHNFSWLLDDDGKVKFTQGTWGDMDSYYSALHGQGIDVVPCFQGGSTVVSGGEEAPEIPVPAGADTLDPASYAVHAQALYQVAARYGSNKNVDAKTINISGAQEVKTGLGLLNTIENSNEPNKSWAGKANYFSPYELAAMCSADYDGHEETIPNAGVHTADPDMKLAMGGLVGYSTVIQYLDMMKMWFDYNRSDGLFAVDVINVHLGPDTDCVEESSLAQRVAELRGWIDKNAPGTELWISEFEVPMSDFAEAEGDMHDNEDYQLKYAQRVARTYFAAYAAGADRITKFQLRDEGEGVYYNSGLVTQKGKWDKKLAWYYLACMNEALEDTELISADEGKEVYNYTFRRDAADETVNVVWSPTDSGKTVKDVKLSADGKKYAYVTVPKDGIAEGMTAGLIVKDDCISLNATETPVFVTFSDRKKTVVNGRNEMLRPERIYLKPDREGISADLLKAPEDATLLQFYNMFDEPQTMPDTVYGDTGKLKAPETAVNKGGITSYVYFGQPCVFNGFAVFDTFGTGGIEVYDAHTDKLLWSSDLGSYMSRSVTLTPDSVPTDCLKIVKGDGAMNELAFYGYTLRSFSWDVDRDGRLDTFDLVLMRQHIADGGKEYTKSDLQGLEAYLLGA